MHVELSVSLCEFSYRVSGVVYSGCLRRKNRVKKTSPSFERRLGDFLTNFFDWLLKVFVKVRNLDVSRYKISKQRVGCTFVATSTYLLIDFFTNRFKILHNLGSSQN